MIVVLAKLFLFVPVSAGQQTNVQRAKEYGILLDEVTDISVQEMLLTFV